MKKRILVGIDPDVDKNGVGINHNGKPTLLNLRFFDLFDKLKALKSEGIPLLVVVEGGWLNKGNWHKVKNGSSSVNAEIGKRTGSNHETGKKIVEMLEYLDITHVVTKPTKSKYKATTFRMMTGIKTRTNQEQRDAYLLIHGL